MIRIVLIVIALLVCLSSLAQKEAQAFLPEIFENYPNVRDFTMSPDGNEIYFTVDDLKSRMGLISFIKKNDSGWSKPKSVSFTGKYRDIEAAFSPDGKRLYFASNSPLHKDSIQPKDYDIWYVDRENEGWSEPINSGAPINTSAHEFYPSITNSGDIYFTAERDGAVGREDIFVSRIKDGNYQEPISLPGELNTEYYEFNAFIAPDERYIVFSGQRPKEGKGRGELYISYNENGKWSKGKLLQKINSEYLDFGPFVDAQSGRLYFTSQKTDVLRHYDKPLDLNAFLLKYRQSPKGLNRIYSIDFKEVIE
ncbi:MAG: hypothetical protein HKN90_04190 [Flavobacteriaceae bacterium]|nr:hypothetical protein [Flavobacteriaceae bacterium]